MLYQFQMFSKVIQLLIYSFFLKIFLTYRLAQNIGQSSLCYTIGPCWLSIYVQQCACIHPKLLICSSLPSLLFGSHKFVFYKEVVCSISQRALEIAQVIFQKYPNQVQESWSICTSWPINHCVRHLTWALLTFGGYFRITLEFIEKYKCPAICFFSKASDVILLSSHVQKQVDYMMIFYFEKPGVFELNSEFIMLFSSTYQSNCSHWAVKYSSLKAFVQAL